ncbi:hypothetical protein GOBAR_AA37708 [Gossypium barbadense]|uniref:Uncharacterized protein n=1 Tax=Gossypium barbadense TaxID=3634 RepID=A0A2P5VVZ5_GOSBA|nr:hypothetical protein GOBAR_AA37708 [Gossypium barbadense]
MVNEEYKPRIPYPNVTRKECSDEQFGKILKLLKKLHINLPLIEALSQMPNAMNFLKELLVNKRKLDEASHKLSFKEVHEPCSRNDTEHAHEERRLRIEKLDEWRAHKSKTHDKPKLCQNKVDTSLNQLKVGDKVLLDAEILTLSLPHRIRKSLLRYSVFFHSVRWSTHGQAHGVPKAVAKQGKRHGLVIRLCGSRT